MREVTYGASGISKEIHSSCLIFFERVIVNFIKKKPKQFTLWEYDSFHGTKVYLVQNSLFGGDSQPPRNLIFCFFNIQPDTI
ncbi:hypothetical protein EF405_15855 [Cyclobacteriaceae bacterium YHN15]|nr:hypothetical protein EF405_15855 [Cyclobacteriaceae bacterium YHN15]